MRLGTAAVTGLFHMYLSLIHRLRGPPSPKGEGQRTSSTAIAVPLPVNPRLHQRKSGLFDGIKFGALQRKLRARASPPPRRALILYNLLISSFLTAVSPHAPQGISHLKGIRAVYPPRFSSRKINSPLFYLSFSVRRGSFRFVYKSLRYRVVGA